ncbi:MAG: tetratricopeptide repeat protein [candidate division Zixibacteria bacterium]|jgi:lipopolysaccharide biosynthesis regulator YciM|nr:tetratricopeptide repeat protein [candidate division Zixibacteria bacterium]
MFQNVLIVLVILLGATSLYLGYERFFRRTRETEPELYVRALGDLLDGRTESAFTKLRQVVAENTNNIDAYLRLGRILREHNKPERALQVHKDLTLRSGLERDQKAAILTQLVEDYLALNDFETAEKALNELISLDPRSRWAHRTQLSVREKRQQWEAAYDTAVELLKLEGNKSKKPLARFKVHMASQLYRKREYHKARIVYKEAIGLDPTLVDAYLAIGDSYQLENRLEDAVNFWRKLISAVPQKGHLVIDRLKKTLFDLGRYGDMVEICENILEHDPKNLQARLTLAEFHEKKGDGDLACEVLEGLVEDYPEDLTVLIEIIRLYLDRGERRKLQDLLQTLERNREKRNAASTGMSPAAPDTTPVRT